MMANCWAAVDSVVAANVGLFDSEMFKFVFLLFAVWLENFGVFKEMAMLSLVFAEVKVPSGFLSLLISCGSAPKLQSGTSFPTMVVTVIMVLGALVVMSDVSIFSASIPVVVSKLVSLKVSSSLAFFVESLFFSMFEDSVFNKLSDSLSGFTAGDSLSVLFSGPVNALSGVISVTVILLFISLARMPMSGWFVVIESFADKTLVSVV